VIIDNDSPESNDVEPKGALPSDKALMAMRLIQRRLYNEEQKQAVKEVDVA